MKQPGVGGALIYESCTMYDVDYAAVLRDGLRPNETWPTTACNRSIGWDYDLQHIRYHSAVTQVSSQYRMTQYFEYKTGQMTQPPLHISSP